jgi:hypothetical protein
MEKNQVARNTPAWRFQVWASFALSTVLMFIGVYHLPVDWWMKGYLIMGLIFTIGSCFGLAKTIRDDFEDDKFEKPGGNAKTETIIREYKG